MVLSLDALEGQEGKDELLETVGVPSARDLFSSSGHFPRKDSPAVSFKTAPYGSTGLGSRNDSTQSSMLRKTDEGKGGGG